MIVPLAQPLRHDERSGHLKRGWWVRPRASRTRYGQWRRSPLELSASRRGFGAWPSSSLFEVERTDRSGWGSKLPSNDVLWMPLLPQLRGGQRESSAWTTPVVGAGAGRDRVAAHRALPRHRLCSLSPTGQERSPIKFHKHAVVRGRLVQAGLCGGAAPHEPLILRCN